MISRALEELNQRFGVEPDYFGSYHLFTRKNDVWCSTPEAGELKLAGIVRRGLRIARVFDFSVRPTTNAVQLLADSIKRNKVDLNELEAKLFLAGRTQEIEVPKGEESEEGVTDGFVVAFHKGFALGIGLLTGTKLKSQVPRSRRVLG